MSGSYTQSPLFRGMTEEEIELCLKEAKADIVGFRKGETIFNQGDTPRYITMLV